MINFNCSPFKKYVMDNTSTTEWTKRRDLCGHLIRHGGSTPNDTFERRRKAICRLVDEGYLEQKTGAHNAIYVRKTR